MRISRFVLLSALFVFAATPARADDARHWVTTWGASPVAPTPATATDEKKDAGFDDETVRLIVNTSVGGSAVRVRLSNVFGKEPLAIGAAHVARRAKGADTAPGTDRALTFEGASSITIPPGKVAVSDPVAFEVPPLADLAVSLYFPKKTGPLTWHGLADVWNYVAATDQAAAAQFPVKETRFSWYVLTDVEVATAAPVPAIVAIGDSITDGFQARQPNHRWPNLLADRLAKAGVPLAVVDEGISGNGLIHDFGSPPALSRFDRDALEQTGVKFVIVLIGINDIGHSQSPETRVTAEELEAGYKQLVAKAHARGLKIFGGTLLPFGGSIYDSPPREAMREAVNRFIRTGGAFDGVIDFEAALRDPANPREMLAKYDSHDHLHPGDEGYEAMAEAVDLKLFGGECG
jgi:lysophospholipase L1-like esterase